MSDPSRSPSFRPEAGINVVRRPVSEAHAILDRAGFRSIRWMFNRLDVTGQDAYARHYVSQAFQTDDAGRTGQIEQGIVTSTDAQVTLTLVSAMPGASDHGLGSDENP